MPAEPSEFTWHPFVQPVHVAVTQVYGFCFDLQGRVLLLEDSSGDFTLPGGKPESGDGTWVDTLRRECLEEAQIVLAEPELLGFQGVREHGREYAQLRYVALIQEYLPRKADPATGTLFRRYHVPLNRAPGLLNWGIDGLVQAASATVLAERKGANIRLTRDSVYRD